VENQKTKICKIFFLLEYKFKTLFHCCHLCKCDALFMVLREGTYYLQCVIAYLINVNEYVLCYVVLNKSVCSCSVVLPMHVIIFLYQCNVPIISHSLLLRDETTIPLVMQIHIMFWYTNIVIGYSDKRGIYLLLKFHISRLLVYSNSLHIQVITHATGNCKSNT
jgi:hypothetical protein